MIVPTPPPAAAAYELQPPVQGACPYLRLPPTGCQSAARLDRPYPALFYFRDPELSKTQKPGRY